jgi:hypothetical protein
MIPFCENKFCALHSVGIPGPEMDCVTYTAHNGQKVRTNRHTIRREDGVKFDLCSTCAYIVALVNEPKK